MSCLSFGVESQFDGVQTRGRHRMETFTASVANIECPMGRKNEHAGDHDRRDIEKLAARYFPHGWSYDHTPRDGEQYGQPHDRQACIPRRNVGTQCLKQRPPPHTDSPLYINCHIDSNICRGIAESIRWGVVQSPVCDPCRWSRRIRGQCGGSLEERRLRARRYSKRIRRRSAVTLGHAHVTPAVDQGRVSPSAVCRPG